MSPFDLSVQAQSPFSVRALSVAYSGELVLDDVWMTLPPGQMSAIIGPNGAGKSTLLKACLEQVAPLAGEVRFWGESLAQQRLRIAYVPQRASVDWEFPARALDVVLMGLYPVQGLLGRLRRTHVAQALDCLARVGMADHANRQIGQLSGGQQQRVFLARALAQGADLFLLDEPFTGVDAASEAVIAELLKSLTCEGKSVLAVHHDLTTVQSYFDHVLLLNRKSIAEGPTKLVFDKEMLERTYGAAQIPHV